jgi:hypothetical protein
MNTTDVFEKNEHFSYTDIPDGLAVNDAAGEAIHFLNPVASAVFLLCDGAHDANAIAAILKEEFALAEPPLQDVLACLGELAAETLIRKVS